MARSLRSKSRRKLMKIKRVRYGKKELIRLKKMLGLPTGEDVAAGNTEVKSEPDVADVDTVVNGDEVQIIPDVAPSTVEEVEDDIAEVIKVKRTHKIRASYRPRSLEIKLRSKKHKREKEAKVSSGEVTVPTGEEEPMDHDQRRRFHKQTLRDQYGNYPEWMNQKTVKMLAKKTKKIKRTDRKKKFTRLLKNGHLRRSKYSKETMLTEAAGLNEAIIQLTQFVV